MELIINKVKILPDAEKILTKIRDDCESRYLSSMEVHGKDVVCQCPFHKGGMERKMACFVYNDVDREDMEFGTYHCFACGATGHLNKLVSFCLSLSIDDANEWLTEYFGTTYVDEVEYIEEFKYGEKEEEQFIDESVLNKFDYNNEDALRYLIDKRHLSKEVIDYFKIGYDAENKSVTFPCRDRRGNLVGVFERSIETKWFHIPKISPKPVYLLYENITMGSDYIYVVESQINALTLFTWGYPAVALFGTGSKSQYDELKKSGIRKFCCVFDGDNAGRDGLNKFANSLRNNSLITYKIVPDGTDVNDLTKEFFDSLPTYYIQ